MELGQRIKNARLESGLSQRQLCGDMVTRNMLSQIENGSARPSMDTLAYFAQRLGKPVSFFLEEDTVTSPNQQIMEQARSAFREEDYQRVRSTLSEYQGPDATFDWEKALLLALAALRLAEQAIGVNRIPYARNLLKEAMDAGETTPYYLAETESLRQILLAKAGDTAHLPDVDAVLLLRAGKACVLASAAGTDMCKKETVCTGRAVPAKRGGTVPAGDDPPSGAVLQCTGGLQNGVFLRLQAEKITGRVRARLFVIPRPAVLPQQRCFEPDIR